MLDLAYRGLVAYANYEMHKFYRGVCTDGLCRTRGIASFCLNKWTPRKLHISHCLEMIKYLLFDSTCEDLTVRTPLVLWRFPFSYPSQEKAGTVKMEDSSLYTRCVGKGWACHVHPCAVKPGTYLRRGCTSYTTVPFSYIQCFQFFSLYISLASYVCITIS